MGRIKSSNRKGKYLVILGFLQLEPDSHVSGDYLLE